VVQARNPDLSYDSCGRSNPPNEELERVYQWEISMSNSGWVEAPAFGKAYYSMQDCGSQLQQGCRLGTGEEDDRFILS
jgi:hypothetical protein